MTAFHDFRDAASWNPTFKHHNQKWINSQLLGLQPVAGYLARAYADTATRRDYVQANTDLREVVGAFRLHDLNLTWGDDDLCRWCELKAKDGARLLGRALATDDPAAVWRELGQGQELAERYGFTLPDAEEVGPLPVLRRLADPAWWRRHARRVQAQRVEEIARRLRRVRKGREIYCSDLTVKRRHYQKRRNQKFLESTTATNEDGQEYTLAELAELFSPKIRRLELMTRIRGTEEYATLCGHAGEFWTFTLPSRFHAYRPLGIERYAENEPWVKAGRPTPKQAGDAMQTMWTRLRSALDRHGIGVYGFRVVEAHHDGCPHWHVLLWMEPEDVGRARLLAWRYAYQDAPWEKGATNPRTKDNWQHPRFTAVAIDPEKGSAAGYIAKYIAKNIAADDAGEIVESDLYGERMQDSVRRVEAWASCWRRRQFQQFGLPSVTVYRELRRAMNDEGCQLDLFDGPEHVRQLVRETAEAADAGDWCSFLIGMGGAMVKRWERVLVPAYWHEHDADTGECLSPVLTRYGEPAKGRVFGVMDQYSEAAWSSRPHTWEIERARPNDAELSALLAAMPRVCFSGAPPGAPSDLCQ